MTMEECITFLGARESIEDLLTGNGCTQRYQAAGEQLRVHGDIRVHTEEGCRCGASKPIEASKDLVENDWQARPSIGSIR